MLHSYLKATIGKTLVFPYESMLRGIFHMPLVDLGGKLNKKLLLLWKSSTIGCRRSCCSSGTVQSCKIHTLDNFCLFHLWLVGTFSKPSDQIKNKVYSSRRSRITWWSNSASVGARDLTLILLLIFCFGEGTVKIKMVAVGFDLPDWIISQHLCTSNKDAILVPRVPRSNELSYGNTNCSAV